MESWETGSLAFTTFCLALIMLTCNSITATLRLPACLNEKFITNCLVFRVRNIRGDQTLARRNFWENFADQNSKDEGFAIRKPVYVV